MIRKHFKKIIFIVLLILGVLAVAAFHTTSFEAFSQSAHVSHCHRGTTQLAACPCPYQLR